MVPRMRMVEGVAEGDTILIRRGVAHLDDNGTIPILTRRRVTIAVVVAVVVRGGSVMIPTPIVVIAAERVQAIMGGDESVMIPTPTIAMMEMGGEDEDTAMTLIPKGETMTTGEGDVMALVVGGGGGTIPTTPMIMCPRGNEGIGITIDITDGVMIQIRTIVRWRVVGESVIGAMIRMRRERKEMMMGAEMARPIAVVVVITVGVIAMIPIRNRKIAKGSAIEDTDDTTLPTTMTATAKKNETAVIIDDTIPPTPTQATAAAARRTKSPKKCPRDTNPASKPPPTSPTPKPNSAKDKNENWPTTTPPIPIPPKEARPSTATPPEKSDGESPRRRNTKPRRLYANKRKRRNNVNDNRTRARRSGWRRRNDCVNWHRRRR
mmetsp:Transcript_30127/g.63512  ORF Transcript_30127/g.63512 Transcript_30127/m.63512 type:complete len:378 (+) Transcript_30127:105-1238(+)